MIEIIFKNGEKFQIENKEKYDIEDIFKLISGSKLVRFYDYIFSLEDILYIKVSNE